MEYNRDHLLNFYQEIEDLRKERDEYIKSVQELDRNITVKVLAYRKNSVYRILDFIHSNQNYILENPSELDTLITHCCNKLNGNIDGIEIELKIDKSKK